MRLKLEKLGVDAEGIVLKGDKNNPEPDHARIVFPGGDVDVVRVDKSDGTFDYWVHIHVNQPGDGSNKDNIMSKIVDARLDIHGKNSSETDLGDFDNPRLFNVAVRISRLMG